MPRYPKRWSPRNTVVLAQIEDATSVILNGVTVYHDETGDRDFHNRNFSSEEVAKRLAEAVGVDWGEVELIPGKDVPIDWNFDDIELAASMRYHRRES